MRPAALPAVSASIGVGALGMCVAATLTAGHPQALVPVALPVMWWLAGLVALRARPDHAGARMLTAFGLVHLVAFGISGAVSVRDEGGWGLTVLSDVLYDGGFALLAVLLATFPAERLIRRIGALVALAAGIVVPVVTAVTTSPLDLPWHVERSAVAAPAPLPLGPSVDLSPVLPVLVLVSLVLLVRRTARASGEMRRQLLWPASVTAILGLLLVATPAGTHQLGRAWAVVFVPVVGALPFALVAGLRRHRLLQVELYAARTLAYTAVLVLVIWAYAAAAAVLGRHSLGAAVLVAVVAALTGQPARQWLEARVDRVVSGGRVHGHVLLRQLAESLEVLDVQGITERTAVSVAVGLESAWVNVSAGEHTARAGDKQLGPPMVAVPLLAGADVIGEIMCGPRPGGWSPDDVELLELLGRHVGLALQAADLTATLEERVEELTASRERIVHAEDAARRRIERDLHDGIQQQLVVLLGQLGVLQAQLEPSATDVLAPAQELARRTLDDLRQLVRGIHPALLTDHGLVAAVEAQVDLLELPIEVDVDPRLEGQRFAADVETAAYYVVSESITNVLKHSGAARARVVFTALEGDGLQLAVVDEGRGFAGDGHGGDGLRGLHDRVEAVGGSLFVSTAEGVGTTVVARFPTRVTQDA